MQRYSGYLFIFLAAFFWALIGPVARFALENGVNALELAFWRASIGGGLFFLHATVTRDLALRSSRDTATFLLFGAVVMGGFFASHQVAIKTGGAALAAVLLYTAPAFVAVFSRIIFKERFTVIKACAIALSLLGVSAISLSSPDPAILVDAALPDALPPQSTFNYIGVFFGILAGFLYSTQYIFAKIYLDRYKTHTIYCYCAIAAAVVLFPFVEFSAKTPADWAVVICLGLVCTYGAYLAYCAGIRRLEPTKAAVLATLEPVIATALAWWVWGELFGLGGWFGAGLVILAVLILVKDGNRPPQKEMNGKSDQA